MKCNLPVCRLSALSSRIDSAGTNFRATARALLDEEFDAGGAGLKMTRAAETMRPTLFAAHTHDTRASGGYPLRSRDQCR